MATCYFYSPFSPFAQIQT